MNKSEKAFVERMEQWEVYRNGWPDFLCVDGGRAIAVEVKSGNGRLAKDQCAMMNVLASSGIDCYVWHPSRGFDLYQEGKRPPLPKMHGALQDRYTRVFSDRVMAEHRRVTDKGVNSPRCAERKGSSLTSPYSSVAHH